VKQISARSQRGYEQMSLQLVSDVMRVRAYAVDAVAYLSLRKTLALCTTLLTVFILVVALCCGPVLFIRSRRGNEMHGADEAAKPFREIEFPDTHNHQRDPE
jgi:hypothetical protein